MVAKVHLDHIDLPLSKGEGVLFVMAPRAGTVVFAGQITGTGVSSQEQTQ